MVSSVDTFGGQLRHFARSVDIVDDQIFERVRQLVYKYVRNELGAAYFEVMRDQPIGRDPGLKMFWSSEDNDHFWPVLQPDGSHTNLITQSFGTERPLWAIAADESPLADASQIRDHWSRAADVSPYRPSADKAIRTVVVLPLKRKRMLGICYFEACEPIGITDVAKAELLLLAEAISILLELYEVNRSQSTMTSSAIFELQEKLESARFPKLTVPHFFVAYSNRAEPKVKNVISEVLHGFGARLEYTDWSEMSDSGEITAQILREISRSRFGVCYFSEPNPAAEHGPPFVDNFNVVFEAGMLNARTASTDAADAGHAGWIPMRENASPPAPFDFAAHRTVQIPRFDDGKLNEARLRDTLTDRISRLLSKE